MPNLIFSPYYDKNCYVANPAKSACALGTKIVGPSGLLSELELWAGLTGKFADDFQRTVLYARAMKKAIGSNPSLFFAKSFAKDKLQTAAVVLGWRDALVKTGWNRDITGSSRLDGIAAAEAHFSEKGEADRWQALLRHANTSPLSDPAVSIEVACPKTHLEPLYRQLFDSMEKTGCTIHYKTLPAAAGLPEKTQVLSFQNDLEMAEWLAQQPLGDNDVVVCDDTSILNLNLTLEDKPQVAAESKAIGAVMQFFTLGLELYHNPLDLNTLLAYLQLPATPLSSLCVKRQDHNGKDYYQTLRSALFNQLVADNGIGEDWNKLINEAVYDYEGHDLSKSKQRTRALLFINQWTRANKTGDHCTVNKNEIGNYLDMMERWAKEHLFDGDKALQFNAVADNCNLMKMILEDESEEIDTRNLMLWASQISRPVPIADLPARKGCMNVTTGVTGIHTPPDTLFWVCTTPEYNFPYDLDFLSPCETDILTNKGIELTDREMLMKYRRETMLGILAEVRKRIVMLECDIIGGKAPVEDPIATELRYNGQLNIQPQTPDRQGWNSKAVAAGSTKQKEYHVNSTVFALLDTEKAKGGLKREMESYSSLDTLIQRPFDYVMDYILHLREYGKAAMADMDTVKGNVAHAYLEKLTGDCNGSISDMCRTHSSDFEKRINFLAETQGAILLLEENDLEFKRFKSLLKKSVDVLLDIIGQNQLTIVGAEQYYAAEVPVIGKMNAYIDYVLTDCHGDYVIIDFKWNEGTRYKKKLEQNDALQLAVYKTVVEKYLQDKNDTRSVSFMGYYVLPRHTLYTIYNNLTHKNIEILVAQNGDDLMKMAANSYSYRMEQLKSGLIEEGEKQKLANLQYAQDTLCRQLYPLSREYDNEELKATAYGNKNIVLKGGLE